MTQPQILYWADDKKIYSVICEIDHAGSAAAPAFADVEDCRRVHEKKIKSVAIDSEFKVAATRMMRATPSGALRFNWEDVSSSGDVYIQRMSAALDAARGQLTPGQIDTVARQIQSRNTKIQEIKASRPHVSDDDKEKLLDILVSDLQPSSPQVIATPAKGGSTTTGYFAILNGVFEGLLPESLMARGQEVKESGFARAYCQTLKSNTMVTSMLTAFSDDDPTHAGSAACGAYDLGEPPSQKDITEFAPSRDFINQMIENVSPQDISDAPGDANGRAWVLNLKDGLVKLNASGSMEQIPSEEAATRHLNSKFTLCIKKLSGNMAGPVCGRPGVFSPITASDFSNGNSAKPELPKPFVPSTPSLPDVEFSMAFFSMSNAPIKSVRQGEEFKVVIYARDLRRINAATTGSTMSAPEAGLYSAYLDLNYDANLVTPGVVNQPSQKFAGTFFKPYVTEISGSSATSGVIDELGAYIGIVQNFPASNLTDVDEYATYKFRLVELLFKAKSVGRAEFAGDAADRSPASDIIFYKSAGSKTAIPGRIRYGKATIDVLP